jgi:hypothetical protein
MWTGVLLLSLVAAAPSARSVSQPSAPAATCDTWQDCRDQVEAALAADAFAHALDLAWRAVQRGPKDDPALMFLLARAQSRAGRPQDALVMIQRLADRGVPTEASTHPDLERMRNLAAWPEVEAVVGRANAIAPPTAEPAGRADTLAAPPATKTPGPSAPVNTAAAAATEKNADAKAARRGALAVEHVSLQEEALRFSTDRFVPAGLAYDAVSRRFVMGDAHGRKLRVVGEGLDHAVDLVRAESAGFFDIRALAIDTRRGDLWVATSAASGEEASLHRLQLISGRPLQSFPLAGEAGRPVHPVDLAVTDGGVVYVLDRDGRVFRARPGSAPPDVIVQLAPAGEALSLALAPGDAVAYVAHTDGVLRVDLNARTATHVAIAAELPLNAIERLRAHRGGFVALQRGTDGARRLLRLELARNGRALRGATTYDVRLDAGSSATAMAVSGDEVALVTGGPETTSGEARASSSGVGPPAELVVRRFRLR